MYEDPIQWAIGSSYPPLEVDLFRVAEREGP